MTKASPARIARRRGRPKGSTVPLWDDSQCFTIAAWWGFRECGCSSQTAAYWAEVATGDKPIRPEDIEGLLSVAGVDIRHTAASLDNHLRALERKAKRAPANNAWLMISATAIKGLILAARTRKPDVYCGMLDVLIKHGWGDVLKRLSERIVEASKSNVPPFEGTLGRRGQELLDWVRRATPKIP